MPHLLRLNWSFRLRIAVLSAVISGGVLLGFGATTWLWLIHEREAALDREIRALAYRHPGWLNNRSNYERVGGAIEFIFGEERRQQLILLALDRDGPTLRLTVSNTGPGIATGDLPRVFDRFHRGDTARSQRRDGAGLGLSLAREIAHAHQGSLTLLDSTPEATTFELRIPSHSPGTTTANAS